MKKFNDNRYFGIASFIHMTLDMPIWKAKQMNKVTQQEKKWKAINREIYESKEFATIKQFMPDDLDAQDTLDNIAHTLMINNFPLKYHDIIGFDSKKYAQYIVTNRLKKEVSVYNQLMHSITNKNAVLKLLRTLY